MYAQLVEGGTTPARRTDMDRIVTGEMVPAREAEPGFAGALNLVDRESGNAMMIILSDPAGRLRSQSGHVTSSLRGRRRRRRDRHLQPSPEPLGT